MVPEIDLDPSEHQFAVTSAKGERFLPARSATYYMHVQTRLLFPLSIFAARWLYLWGLNRFPLVFKGAEIQRRRRWVDEWQPSGLLLIRAKRILSLKHEQMVWLQEFLSSTLTEPAVFCSVIVLKCFIRAFFFLVEGQKWGKLDLFKTPNETHCLHWVPLKIVIFHLCVRLLKKPKKFNSEMIRW